MTEIAGVRRFPRGVGLVVLAVAGLCSGAVAEDEVLLGEEAGASIAVEGERRLIVDGIHGAILVRGESSDELRFSSVDADGEAAELPVALWSDGSSFRLAPIPGTEGRARKLEIAVPAETYVTIRTTDSEVKVASVDGAVEIEGGRLRVVARELGSGVEIDFEKARLYLERIASDVILRGGLEEADVRDVGGLLFAQLRGGTARFGKLFGGADLDLSGCTLAVSWARGEFRLVATGGEAEIEELQHGARLKLSGTPIGISESSGSIEIESDNLVRFHENDASMVITGLGTSVLGDTNRGPVSIEADGGSVALERIDGRVFVKGSQLDVELRDAGDAVVVETTSSSVEITGAAGEVSVENRFGDITVRETSKKLTVVSENGNVFLNDVGGPVQLEADGPLVEVDWEKLPADADAQIRNDGGDVNLQFPPRAGCVIDASSSYGTIESELPGVAVSGDGERASGMFNRRGRPRVKVRAEGWLRLLTGPSARERHAQ